MTLPLLSRWLHPSCRPTSLRLFPWPYRRRRSWSFPSEEYGRLLAVPLGGGFLVAIASSDEPADEFAVRELDFRPWIGRNTPLVAVLGVLEPVDILARRTIVTGNGQLEHAVAAVEIDDILNRALAVGSLADDHRSLMILKGGRNNLGGRGRVLIDQHDHRQVFIQGHLFGLRISWLRCFAPWC